MHENAKIIHYFFSFLINLSSKPFVRKTGWSYGLFNSDGTLNMQQVALYSRTYAQAVAGTTLSFTFNITTGFVRVMLSGCNVSERGESIYICVCGLCVSMLVFIYSCMFDHLGLYLQHLSKMKPILFFFLPLLLAIIIVHYISSTLAPSPGMLH